MHTPDYTATLGSDPDTGDSIEISHDATAVAGAITDSLERLKARDSWYMISGRAFARPCDD
jgi:hypothetical protein